MRNSYCRDPLAAVRAKGQRDRMDRIRREMTPGQVEAGMEKIIREKLGLNEPIALEDFQLANLPMEQVAPLFKRVLQKVQNKMAVERG